MSKRFEFYYDFGSPTTYLAATQIDRIAEETGAEAIWTPALLGGVFKATGNASPVMVAAKGAWMATDLDRTAKKFGVPLAFNPHFPVNTLALMRAATGYRDTPHYRAVVSAGFNALWVDHKNINEEAGLREVAAEAGVDGDDMIARIADPAVKDRLRSETERAVARGVFGLPAFFVGDTLIFGQDRLDWLREELAV